MAEPRLATQEQIRHALATLQHVAFTVANRNGLVDGASTVDAELGRLAVDIGPAIKTIGRGRDGRPELEKRLANILLRTCTTAQLAGVDLSTAVLARVAENARKVK
jgi:hypothetical protein